MAPPSTPHLAVLAVVGMLGLTGCGSTVQQRSQVAGPGLATGVGSADRSAAAGGSGGGSAVTSSSGGTSPAGSTGGPATLPGAGSAGPAPAGTSGGSGTVGSTATTGGSGASVNVPGVTDKAVYVGLPYSPGADQTAAALGASSVTSGDTKAEQLAIIADINRHGGVAGRKMVPVFHTYQTSGSSVDQQQSEACVDYTQDHHTFAVLDHGRNSFYKCLSKAAIAVPSYDYGLETADFQTYPYLVDPGTVAVDREMRPWVSALVRQKYFAPWDSTLGRPGTKTVVGILSVDYPSISHAVDRQLLPALAAAGVKVDKANVIVLSNGNSTADAGNTVAAIQSATLKFQQNGVTHVLIFDNAGGVTLFFAHDTASQRYYPRWEISTENSMQSWLTSGDVTAQQANGAAGIGWQPTEDLPDTANGDNSPYSTPLRRHCLAVLAAAGIRFSSSNAKLIALEFCDVLYFVQHVMNRMDPQHVTREAFMATVNGLGSSFVPTTLTQTFFGPSQHDGVALGYDLVFDGTCKCMRYAGSGTRVPSAS